MNSEKKLSAALDAKTADEALEDEALEMGAEFEIDEADDSALSDAEQDRFRKMREAAEAQIEALDKHLTESGVIRKTAGETESEPDNITENMPENISGEYPGESPKESPKESSAAEVSYRSYDDPRADDKANYAADAPVSPPVSDMPLRSAPWQLLAGFGISFAVRVGILGIWLGSYIDRRWLGDTGIGAMAIIVLVIFYSFYMLYRDLMRLASSDASDKKTEDKKTGGK